MNEAFITHMRKIAALHIAELKADGVTGTGKQRGRHDGYTPEDIKFMINTAGEYTCKELTTLLNRTPGSIAGKAYTLGIKLKSGGYSPMTEEEIHFLVNNAHLHTCNEMVALLGRNGSNLRIRAAALGVSFKPAPRNIKARAEHERVMA